MEKSNKKLFTAFVGIIFSLALAGCQNPFLQLGKEAVASAVSSPFAQSASPEYVYQDGTEEYPFLVYDVATLKRVGSEAAGPAAWDMTKYYLQIKDIEWDKHENWTPIGDGKIFTGTYDGNGKIISGLTCNYPSVDGHYYDSIGLFSKLYYGTVKGLGLVDAYIEGATAVGGIAGENYYGTIQNCYFTGSVIGEFRTGGIAGYSNGVIENCYANGSFHGDSLTGGIVGGMVYGTVKNCYSIGNCSVTRYGVGGVVGEIQGDTSGRIPGQILNCYSTAKVEGANYETGGIAGGILYNAALFDCVALNQSISGDPRDEIGRVLGSVGGPISNNYAWGGIEVNGDDEINGNHDDKNGESIAPSQYNDLEWWTSENWYYEEAWDFDTVWEWDADRQLPVLRGVGGQ